MKPVIETHDLCKSYNGRTVVDHLNLTVPQGCVYGFLGPNGAGKSTSMKMLLGLVHPTGGSAELLGHTMNETNRIPLLRQTGSLIESPSGYLHLTARENLAIVADLKGVAHKDIDRVLEIVHLTADANRKVGQYSLGMKQRLGIAMALLGSPKLLILDEPTASLTPQEIEGLMEIIENLTADGKSVILITHKLKEITASSDNCTIIRQGKYIQTVKVADVNENELAAMMVGRDVNFKVDKKEMEPGEVVLEVKDLHAKDYRGVEILKGFNLNVRKGEIVGLAGVDGNGQTELVEVLTGFKYIGEQMLKYEKSGEKNYVFGFEESYGCLPGTYARDKDAPAAVCMLCEVAAFYKSQGKTLWDGMIDMYEKYGYYREGIATMTLKGIDGAAQIQQIMDRARQSTPAKLGAFDVLAVRDYKADTRKDLKTGEVTATGLPSSNVLYYELSDNAWCCVRPSGTEPKIKFYVGVKGDTLDGADQMLEELKAEVLKHFE